jgi:hypothetical protein
MKLISTLRAAALLSATIGTINAQEISWNFDVYGTVNPGTTPNANVAGVVPAPNWNDAFYLNGYANTGTGLMDSTGSLTPVGYTLSYPNGTWSVTGNPGGGAHHPGQDANGTFNMEMLNGYMNVGGSATESIALTGINYSQYSIYVYFSSDTAGRTGTVSDGGTTYDFSTVGPGEVSGPNAPLSQTSDSSGANPSADYAVFSGLTGSSQTITAGIPSFGGIAAFQIVATPEPSAIALVMLGGGIMLIRRRK